MIGYYYEGKNTVDEICKKFGIGLLDYETAEAVVQHAYRSFFCLTLKF